MGAGPVRIGVAAVQGAVSEHVAAFARALEAGGVDGTVTPVHTLEAFREVDALAPGINTKRVLRLMAVATLLIKLSAIFF